MRDSTLSYIAKRKVFSVTHPCLKEPIVKRASMNVQTIINYNIWKGSVQKPLGMGFLIWI